MITTRAPDGANKWYSKIELEIPHLMTSYDSPRQVEPKVCFEKFGSSTAFQIRKPFDTHFDSLNIPLLSNLIVSNIWWCVLSKCLTIETLTKTLAKEAQAMHACHVQFVLQFSIFWPGKNPRCSCCQFRSNNQCCDITCDMYFIMMKYTVLVY